MGTNPHPAAYCALAHIHAARGNVGPDHLRESYFPAPPASGLTQRHRGECNALVRDSYPASEGAAILRPVSQECRVCDLPRVHLCLTRIVTVSSRVAMLP